MFAALGRFSFRRRWWVLGAWAVVLVAGIVLGGHLFDRLRTVDALRPDAESMRAQRQIQELVADGPIVFAVVAGKEIFDPELVHDITAVTVEIKKIQHVVDVDDLYNSPGGRTGADNASTLVWVELAESLSDRDLEVAEDRVRALLETIDAPTVLVGGDHLAERAFGEQAVRDLAVGESIAFILLLAALVVFFGGIVAASLPVAVAIVGVSATLLVLLGLSALTEIGEYSLNIVTLLGIGLAVDYALLIVARYREERAAGARPERAVETSMTYAGRAVAISGLAVAAALTGLVAFAEPLLSSMALGGTAIALLTTALALTAVPALIAVAGDRIPLAGAETWVTRAVASVRTRVPHRGGASPKQSQKQPSEQGKARVRPARASLMVRLAKIAQARPFPVAVATTLGLLVLALPLLGANLANSDERSLPASLEVRRAYDAYRMLFSGDAASVTVVATVNAASTELRDYLNELNQRPEVFRLELRRDVPAGSVIIDLTPKGESGGEQSRELVADIRAAGAAFPLAVAGPAAEVVDYQDSVAARLPYVVVAVVIAMLVLLFALTRSIVVPAKAVVLNVLTFAATMGVLVAVFQWGWGEPLLRFESWGALDITTPLLLFVFILGLSMDYEVFLLSRIREEYDRRPDNDRAVLVGIARSGPVVTAAAACITIVFLGFAVGGLVAVKEIGVGMAVAVILDVTVVRSLLLPAVMSLLGEMNWWSPWERRPVRPTSRVPSANAGKVPR